MRFVLVRQGQPPHATWWFHPQPLPEGGTALFWADRVWREPNAQCVGTWCAQTAQDAVLAEQEAACPEDLDWGRTTLLQPTSPLGWLDRDGHLWGCHSAQHAAVAHMVLRAAEGALEARGYVRVYTNVQGCRAWATGVRSLGGTWGPIQPSAEQCRWLEAQGLLPGAVGARGAPHGNSCAGQRRA